MVYLQNGLLYNGPNKWTTVTQNDTGGSYIFSRKWKS